MMEGTNYIMVWNSGSGTVFLAQVHDWMTRAHSHQPGSLMEPTTDKPVKARHPLPLPFPGGARCVGK